MSSDRTFFVGGNWKMNGNKESMDKITGFLQVDKLNSATGIYFRPKVNARHVFPVLVTSSYTGPPVSK